MTQSYVSRSTGIVTAVGRISITGHSITSAPSSDNAAANSGACVRFPRDDNAAAVKRQALEPVESVAERHNLPDDDQHGRLQRELRRQAGERPGGGSLRGTSGPAYGNRGSLRGPAAGNHALRNIVELRSAMNMAIVERDRSAAQSTTAGS